MTAAGDPGKTTPTISDVIDVGKSTPGTAAQKADAMQPLIDQIKAAKKAQGWTANRFDNAAGSGFLGAQGEAVVVGSDGTIYVGKVSGQAQLDLVTGARPPSQIPGLNPAR
jgi:hypothetical protein